MIMRPMISSHTVSQNDVMNIREQKEAAEALRIAALVYEHSSEAMMVTDAGNRILSINPAFTRITG